MRRGLAWAATLAVLLTASTAWAEGDVAKPDWMSYKNPYANAAGALSSPHRNNDEIAAWAQQAATDTLTFSPENYREKLGSFRKYFTPGGWEPYARFLRGTGIMEAVGTKNYNITTLSEDTPDIIDSREIDGIWLWVVKLPISVAMTNGQGPNHNARYYLTMDIARTTDDNGEAIAITGWRVEPHLQ